MSDTTLFLLTAWITLTLLIVFGALVLISKIQRGLSNLAIARQSHEEIRARASNYDEVRDRIRQAFAISLGGPGYVLAPERDKGKVSDEERWIWFATHRGLSKEDLLRRQNFGGIHDIVELKHLPLSLLEPLREIAKVARPRAWKKVDRCLLQLSGYRAWAEIPKTNDSLLGVVSTSESRWD